MSVVPFSIGIDLGNSYLCAGTLDKTDNIIRIVENFSVRKHLNYVTFKQNTVELGDLSKSKIRTNISNTVFDCKILLGRKFDNVDKAVRWPFDLEKEEDRIVLKLKDRSITPEEITSIFLRKIKNVAEEFHKNQEIKSTVITVPNSFSNSQREATLDAAKITGLNAPFLVDDSTAAAIAIAHQRKFSDNKNVLIFDLGSYFLNLSVVEFIKNGEFKVKGAESHPNLGGESIDYEIARELIKQHNLGHETSMDKRALVALMGACEKAKKMLSNSLEANIYIDSLQVDKDFQCNIKREEFERICNDLFEKLIEKVNLLLSSQKVKLDIDEIFLIGGSTLIPKVQEKLAKNFNGKPLNFTMNTNETLAYGAAVLAAKQADTAFENKFTFITCFDFDLTIFINESKQNKLVIPSGSRCPESRSCLTLDFDNQQDVSLVLSKNGTAIEHFKNVERYLTDNSRAEICMSVNHVGLVTVEVIQGEKRHILTNAKTRESFNLKSEQIDSIIRSNREEIERQNDSKNQSMKKNELENKCYDLMKKLADKSYDAEFVSQNKKEISEVLNKIKTKFEENLLSEQLNKIESRMGSYSKDRYKVPIIDEKELLEELDRLRCHLDSNKLSMKASHHEKHCKTLDQYLKMIKNKNDLVSQQSIDELKKRIRHDEEIYSLEIKCQQSLTTLKDSKCRTEFIEKTREEIQSLSDNIVQQYDSRNYGELDKRLNEIENEITQEEITRKKTLYDGIGALKRRAENLSLKTANFDTKILQQLDFFLNEETDLDLIENVQSELDNKVNLEEKKYEDSKVNEGARENLKNKCLLLIVKLEEKLSGKKLYQFSKALFIEQKQSAIDLIGVLNKNEDFDSNNIERKLLELDKNANDGEHLILLESLHSELIDLLSESYCDDEFCNKTKQDVDIIHERIPKDFEEQNESLKTQMQRIKDDIIQNEKNYIRQEKEKKEGFKARCLDLKNSISAMISKRQNQNGREELLITERRLSKLVCFIANSNSSQFEEITTSLCKLETVLDNLETKFDAAQNKDKDDIQIKKAQKLFSKWDTEGKIYTGVNYYHQMQDQCQKKLDNSISFNDFFHNINELIKKCNQECDRQHFHKSKYINKEDMEEFYDALGIEQSFL